MLILKNFPFVRLLLTFCAGIVMQWYFQATVKVCLIIIVLLLLFLLAFSLLPLSKRFTLRWLNGSGILLLFLCAGILTTRQQNIHNDNRWYANAYMAGADVLLTIKEPLVEKANSYKALATVSAVYKDNLWVNTSGDILLYFKKEAVKPSLQYGSQIISAATLQPVKNNGNPASLNYNRYCLFQSVTGQAFLKNEDYKILLSKNKNLFQHILFNARDWSLSRLKQHIHSPRASGIAEALLIGYRNDLDKDLVQAYSNTGAVHIIAISGLHIALIYAALLKIFSVFKAYKIKKWLEPLIALCIIWLFTLIAGASPSVLRAAVMFSFILAGKFLGRSGNVFNTLAASAFVLLLVNPFYLWDVGFQLSYAAVLSIVIFFKPINNLLYFRNKSLRWVWQLSAVSLAAQVLTFPLVIYHFHQFPLLFLFSNLLVVPLSGLVLLAELLLFSISWWPLFASFTGMLIEKSIEFMNGFIEHIDKFNFSVWNGLQVSLIQLILLYGIIIFSSMWVFYKKPKALIASLSFALVFFTMRDTDLIMHKAQQKIIVYNVPKKCAIDFIAGNHCRFAGDSVVIANASIKNFNIKPAHTRNRIYASENALLPDIKNYALNVNGLKVLVLNSCRFTPHPPKKIRAGLVILTNNFNAKPSELNDLFDCSCFVADSSIPEWKAAKWKKEFQRLHLRFYSVAQNGAYTLKM